MCSLLFACSTILGTSDLMAQGRGGKSSPSDHAATVKKIYGAVKAGKLSAKDAKAKMEALKKSATGGKGKPSSGGRPGWGKPGASSKGKPSFGGRPSWGKSGASSKGKPSSGGRPSWGKSNSGRSSSGISSIIERFRSMSGSKGRSNQQSHGRSQGRGNESRGRGREGNARGGPGGRRGR